MVVQRGLWHCKEGTEMREETLSAAARKACQLPLSYSLLIFILIWSQHCQLYLLQLCTLLGGCCISVCLCADAVRHSAQPGCRLMPNKRA